MKYPVSIDLKTPANFRAFKAHAKLVGSETKAAASIYFAGAEALKLADPNAPKPAKKAPAKKVKSSRAG